MKKLIILTVLAASVGLSSNPVFASPFNRRECIYRETHSFVDALLPKSTFRESLKAVAIPQALINSKAISPIEFANLNTQATAFALPDLEVVDQQPEPLAQWFRLTIPLLAEKINSFCDMNEKKGFPY